MRDLDTYLEAIVAGDTAAFGRWVAGAEPALRRGLAPFATHVDVEVVVQEALLRAWQLAPRIEPDGRGNSLLRFTARTARHLAIDETRRRSLPVPEWGHELESVAPIEPDPLLRRAVEQCREHLPTQPARAFEARLSAQGAESDESLATQLGMRLNTFLKNFGRARQLLVECLSRQGIRLGESR